MRGSGSTSSAARRIAYGPDASQFGELVVPRTGRRPGVVVLIHGGFWRAQYDLHLMSPIAADLARRGCTTWNLEYRRVGAGRGGGGGWPATLLDVAAGIDALAEPSLALDVGRVVTIGHSAGGHLGAWAAARPGLPASVPGAAPRVPVTGVISLAGVLDLAAADADGLGGGAVAGFLGGSRHEVPARYAAASPIERIPFGVPVRCVHGRRDRIVPLRQSTRFVDAALTRGEDAAVAPVPGDHFAVIDPRSRAWRTVVAVLDGLLPGD